jgi:TolA-binding protein
MEDKEKCEIVLEYRMEQVEKKLDQVEKKLDKVTDLLLQTAEQEQRIKALEQAIKEMKDSNRKNIDRWLSPLISAVVSGLVAFVLLKVGLK